MFIHLYLLMVIRGTLMVILCKQSVALQSCSHLTYNCHIIAHIISHIMFIYSFVYLLMIIRGAFVVIRVYLNI